MVTAADPLALATALGLAALLVAAAAEALHLPRVRAAAPLAFGPRRRLAVLAVIAPVVRAPAAAATAWGLAVLLLLPPSTFKAGEANEKDVRHLVLALDVSPSMYLDDAGPKGDQKRSHRAADLIQSFFGRVQAERYKTTVVAVYTGAKPVVKDTADREVVRNILTDLPLAYAFKAGETDIFSGLTEAAVIAKPWPPGSAVLVVVTDGDTVPAQGMPKMPPSVGQNVVIVGVGNPNVGKSVGGHLSRQDVSTLRQVAARLNGVYHDGNDKHLSTTLVSGLDEKATTPAGTKWGPREWARLAAGLGAAALALLPAGLLLAGTGWTPGRHPRTAKATSPPRPPLRSGEGEPVIGGRGPTGGRLPSLAPPPRFGEGAGG